MKLRRVLGVFVLGLCALALAVTLLPPVVLPDAPAPASLARFVDGARRRISAEAPLLWPLHVRFVAARCSGQRVALIFERWQPPYLGTPYAIAMRGSTPTSVDDSWMLAMGRGSPDADDEFLYQMGADTIACP